jgi:hypothetical protein
MLAEIRSEFEVLRNLVMQGLGRSGATPPMPAGVVQALRFTLTLAEIQAAGAVTGISKNGPAFPANAVLLGGGIDTSSPVQNAGGTATGGGVGNLLGINTLGSDWLLGAPGFDVTSNQGYIAGLDKNGAFTFSGPAAPFPVGGLTPRVSINLSVNLNTITRGQVPVVLYYAIVP